MKFGISETLIQQYFQRTDILFNKTVVKKNIKFGTTTLVLKQRQTTACHKKIFSNRNGRDRCVGEIDSCITAANLLMKGYHAEKIIEQCRI